MQNKPNFQNDKNALTLVITMTNNDEQRTMNYPKQTQSNPISIIAGIPYHYRNLKKNIVKCRFAAMIRTVSGQ
jgi:hypothetical protein